MSNTPVIKSGDGTDKTFKMKGCDSILKRNLFTLHKVGCIRNAEDFQKQQTSEK